MNRVTRALGLSVTLLVVVSCRSEPAGPGTNIPPATFDVTNEGAGAANVLALEPLVTGTRTGLRTVVGQRPGGLVEVAYTQDPVYAKAGKRFARYHSFYRRGEHGLEYLGIAGDLVGVSATRSVAPILLVPNVVRYGMSWTTGHDDLTGQPFTLSVTGRSEEQTPFGLGVVWTIEFVGSFTFADPMRFLEGYGMLSDFGEPLRGRQRPFESFILPKTDPAAEADVAVTPARDVALPEALADYVDNFRVEGVTAIERPDGRRTIAVLGVSTVLHPLSLLPEPLDDALCLEYNAGGISAGSKIVELQPLKFPYGVNPAQTSAQGTTCDGFFDLSSVVRRSSDGAFLTMSRLGGGAVTAIQNTNGSYYYPSLFLANGEDDPWVLVGNGESFLLHGPEHGAVTVVGSVFPEGRAVPADWGLLTVYDFDRTSGPARRDGYFFAPEIADLTRQSNVFYHLTPHGLLGRSTANTDSVGRFEPLFATLDDVTLQTSEAGAHRVLTTTTDGMVRRLALRNGLETLETLGRVQLEAGEQLRAAIEVGNAGQTLAFIGNYSGPVLLGGNECPGCTRVPFQPTGMRIRYVDFGSASTPYTPPPALSITARNIGADVLVCWGDTKTAFDATGWKLGGKSVAAIALADVPCALALRDPSTTTAELALAGSYAVEANVPDVGMVRIAVPERDAPSLGGGAASMVGDVAITSASQPWLVAGSSFGVAPSAFFTNSVFDDVAGVWTRDQRGMLAHHGERWVQVRPTGDYPESSYFDLAAPLLGGGAVVSARPLESPAYAGPAYALSPDGTATRLADSTPTDRALWLRNGRSCAVGVAITCFAPNATTPDMTIAVTGVSFALSKLQSLNPTSALAIAGGKAYRIDLVAGTATQIASTSMGLLKPNATRHVSGSFWAPVVPGPGETDAPLLRIARIDADSVDVYEVKLPAYLDAAATVAVTHVYPGERVFAVATGADTIRFAPPAN